jgi:predicted nucleic acid-binding protein
VTSSVPLAYLDTSALVKLVVREPESGALRLALQRWPHRVSSEIAVLELLRVARRQVPNLEQLALNVLAGLALQRLDRRTLMRAARLDPPHLRSLDAIHLASALELMPHVGAFFAYDHRLHEAARQAGLPVEAPL